MLIAKWGNSLAIRIPCSVIEALQLREGDDVKVTVADARGFVISKTKRNREVMDFVAQTSVKLPADFDFSGFMFK